jgi:Flp pilus assembly protein TadG
MRSATQTYRRLMNKLRCGEEGQSLVEISLTLPVLVLCLLAAAMFAQGAYYAIEVANAAKAGVAYAAQSSATAADTAGTQAAAILDANNITLATPTVTVRGVCSSGAACTGNGNSCKNTDCSTPGDHIETIVSVDTATTFAPVIHVPGLPASYTLRGHATQICLPQ